MGVLLHGLRNHCPLTVICQSHMKELVSAVSFNKPLHVHALVLISVDGMVVPDNFMHQHWWLCYIKMFGDLQLPHTKAFWLFVTGMDHTGHVHLSSSVSSVHTNHTYKDGELLPLHLHLLSYWCLCPQLFHFLMFWEFNHVFWSTVLCSLQNSSLRLAHIEVATAF